MKQTCRKLSCLLSVLFTVALAVAASAQEASTSSKPWLQFKQAKAMKNVEDLKPGDQIALVCPKCKTVTVADVSSSKEHLRGLKQSGDAVVHICKTCGGDEFCCVLKKEDKTAK